MKYLYHMVPENMTGDLLMPLNTLKKKHHELYLQAVKKYAGREYVLRQRIPTLDCLWNDVLHLTAVKPADVRKALKSAGFPGRSKWKWFKINPNSLDLPKSTVFLYRGEGRPLEMSDFSEFNPEDLSMYGSIAPRTKEYYKAMKAQDKKPLIFHLVPHILYKGKIKTKDLKIIEA